MQATATATPETLHRARRAALASFLGGALEYYNFFVYTTAASLIFSRIFFPAGDPTIALIQSFAVFGVGYIFRPLGGFAFGHLGDRIGRKNTLVLTLTIMGASTFLIGVLPTYATAGYLAPILLVVLRILQGLSAGGETAGASTLTVEESPEGRRAFFTSFTSSGISAGIVLASLVFVPIAALPAEARDTWGWRIPFLLSLVVLVVAYLVRRRLEEPRAFTAEQYRREVPKLPIVQLFRTHWGPFLTVVLMSFVIIINTFMQSFGLAFATQIGTLQAADMLWASVVGNLVAVVSQPFLAQLADRIGRRPVFAGGLILSAGLVFVYFSSISAGNMPLVFVTTCVITGITYAAANGIYTSWFAEQSGVQVRYSGLAIGLQVGILNAGFSPALGTALVGGNIDNWLPAAFIVVGAAAIALIGAALARETFRTPLDLLGNGPRR
ncbi:MFS transporter [Curtobacterium sp. Csp1]|uniref:MFS transporter n=1 Tax=Curtobacterium sp. Csp1 TaxID=2495429 RepID=UPI001597F36B|nr:MFS transporter [Curtobacterium sp. Csp1]QKS18890.1 MFS transporter [Curtobacterium sp. Csp1]